MWYKNAFQWLKKTIPQLFLSNHSFWLTALYELSCLFLVLCRNYYLFDLIVITVQWKAFLMLHDSSIELSFISCLKECTMQTVINSPLNIILLTNTVDFGNEKVPFPSYWSAHQMVSRTFWLCKSTKSNAVVYI